MSEIAFSQKGADVFIPDGSGMKAALKRTTHLGVGAHPDDLEFFAWPGIDACFGRSDRWFSGITITDGGGSPRTGPYADWSNEKMMKARAAEQRAAAVIGEYSMVVQLAYSSALAKDPEHLDTVDDLARLLSAMEPETVYMHNPADRHDTHIACFHRTLAALRRLPKEKRPRRVYGCEVWRGLDWLVGDDRVALRSGARPHVQSALAGVFDTQIAGGKRYDLAVPARRLANATFDDSHTVDKDPGLTYAIDLTPLVHEDAMDPIEFTVRLVENFKKDVRSRLERYT